MARPWASVRRICEAEHMVVLGEGNMYLFEKQTGHMEYFRQESGNYVIDVWVHTAGGFAGQ